MNPFVCLGECCVDFRKWELELGNKWRASKVTRTWFAKLDFEIKWPESSFDLKPTE